MAAVFGELASITPYVQFDYYKNPETINNKDFGGEGLCALAESPYLTRLRGLALYAVPLTPEAFRALASSPHLANLEALDLSYTELDEVSALRLAESPYLTKLRALSVDGNALSRKGREAIRKRWRFAWC